MKLLNYTNVKGSRTATSLEKDFLDAFNEICKMENLKKSHFLPVFELCFEENMASSIRTFVLAYYRRLANLKTELDVKLILKLATVEKLKRREKRLNENYL